jgi:heme-degrading monooxygenase HmoA
MTPAYTYIWVFKVHPQHVDAFLRHYRDGGAWTQLFRRARGYVGTQLLRDAADPTRFVTIDTWSTARDYEAFRAAFASEYAALDRLCDGLTLDETLIGHFSNAIDSRPTE